MEKSVKAFRSAGLALLLVALAAPAGAQTFQNLPGVKSQEQVERENRVVCDQVIVPRDPTSTPRYKAVNFCRRGDGPVFQSGRLPPSIIRQLRGFNY